MAKHKKKVASSRDNARIREQKAKEFHHDMAVLRRKGFYKGKTRSLKPTPALRKLIRDHRDVIEGQSIFRRIWHWLTGKKVKEVFGDRARVSRGHIIVPKPAGQKASVRFNRETGKLVTYSVVNGKRVKSEILPTNADLAAVQASRKGEWSVVIGSNQIGPSWQNYQDMVDYMVSYQHEGGHYRADKWQKFIRFVEVRTENVNQ